jgi:hypothetical protein
MLDQEPFSHNDPQGLYNQKAAGKVRQVEILHLLD